MVAQGLWYNAAVVQPRIVPRAEHPISRRDIDPDALKVLYRLRQFDHVAYLVGGSVRDLLLSRKPKDFDIGTSAHPYQVKKLFRNCWIIGRRFRLAHVRFGLKTIEVATFRKIVPAGTESEPSELPLEEAPPGIDAIATHRSLLGTASPSRLIEEYYKILRSGYAEQTFRGLAEHRLLEAVTPEIQRGTKNAALWQSLASLDAYRRKFESAPAALRN